MAEVERGNEKRKMAVCKQGERTMGPISLKTLLPE